MQKIQSFTDLNAWKEAHTLVLTVYKLTRQFPEDEKFGLVTQMRRAAVSITSNISEGFARKGAKEKIQYCYMALGSLNELQNQLVISRDIGYISSKDFQTIAEKSVVISKLINGLIKSKSQAT